jgi:uncharacterized protein YqeY
MTFKELQAAMVAAMKEKNRVKKEVIADMVACAKNMAIEQGCKDNITDEIVAAAILKSKKMCQDQIDTCPANRPDKLEAYNLCMTYINELAPKMMTEEEVLKIVENSKSTPPRQQLCQVSGYDFYNTSKYTLKELLKKGR